MRINKKEREEIRAMFGGKCAYCGEELGDKFHIDHIKPIFRGWDEKPDRAGEDVKDNLVPACIRCNLRKGTASVQKFREEIKRQIETLNKRNFNYKLAKDFRLVKETENEVVFWFEKYGGKL